jgi:hypothetical protein
MSLDDRETLPLIEQFIEFAAFLYCDLIFVQKWRG